MINKRFLIVIFILIYSGVNAADFPIIFVHGHKSEAKPYDIDDNGKIVGGWGTWNPQNADSSREHPSSMTDIIDEHYGGYVAGNPLNCDKNSTLSSTNGNTKVMYNYSYYILQIYKNIL
jgi:hypothetical protein